MRRQSDSGGQFVYNHQPKWRYSALSYHPTERYLYAISQPRLRGTSEENAQNQGDDSQFSAGHLLKISPADGTIEDRGPLALVRGNDGVTAQLNRDLLRGQGISEGFLDAQGRYWVSNTSDQGSGALYEVNTTNGQVTPVGGGGSNANRLNSRGLASLSGNAAHLWGIAQPTSASTAPRLQRVSTDNHQVREFDLAGSGLDQLIEREQGRGMQWTNVVSYSSNLLFLGYSDGNAGGRNSYYYPVLIVDGDSANPEFRALPRVFNVASAFDTATTNGVMANDVDLAVDKELVSEGDGAANTLQWNITVRNLSDCVSNGFSLIEEIPAGFDDVTLQREDSGTWKDVETVTVSDGDGQQLLLFNHGKFNAGEEIRFRLSVSGQSAAQCVENSTEIVGINHDPNKENNKKSDAWCSLHITKKVVDNATGSQAHMAPGGHFGVTYEVTVENSGPVEQTYTLTDSPQFTNAVRVHGIDFYRGGADEQGPTSESDIISKPASSATDGRFEMVQDRTIAPNDTDTYIVTVKYSPDADDASGNAEERAQCVDGEPENGLFNTASVEFAGQELSADACADYARPSLQELKIGELLTDIGDGGQVRHQPLDGAEFSIYEALDNNFVGRKLIDVENPEDGDYHTANLVTGQKLFLNQDKAAPGSTLLPQPVLFHLELLDSGEIAVIVGAEEAEHGVALGINSKSDEPPYLLLNNVNAGVLPDAGGTGMLGYLAAAMVLLLLAAYLMVGRREKAAR